MARAQSEHPFYGEFLRCIKIHFGQSIFDCMACIDRKAGYCEGKGYTTYQQVADCVNKKHFNGMIR